MDTLNLSMITKGSLADDLLGRSTIGSRLLLGTDWIKNQVVDQSSRAELKPGWFS